MGSMARKMKREAMKRAHQRFGQEWSSIRKAQAEARSNGEAIEGQLLHRRKPTFAEYQQAVKNAEQQAVENLKKKLMEQANQDAKIDTSWDEEESNATPE